jgi:hypothetical protein
MLTREQFIALPTNEQLWEVYQELTTERETPRAAAPAGPTNAKAPKYDGQLSRKGGMAVWMSEMLLEDLRYWMDRNAADTTGQYAEKNQKQAKTLSYWVAYREVAPLERWTGLRNDDVVTGAVPTRDPEQHPWAKRGERSATPASSGPAFGGASEFDDVPF